MTTTRHNGPMPTPTPELPLIELKGWLTTQQAADLAGVTRSTWSSYVSRDQAPGPAGRLDDRTPLWDESEVRAWLKARGR